MTPLENIYVAAGELAYAVAMADGSVQREENEKFERILKEEFDGRIDLANPASIIFQIMRKERISSDHAYQAAIRELNINSHYLSASMKEHLIHVMERVAKSFPPKTHHEHDMIKKFIVDVNKIKVDTTLSKGL